MLYFTTLTSSWPSALDSDREWGKCSLKCKFRPPSPHCVRQFLILSTDFSTTYFDLLIKLLHQTSDQLREVQTFFLKWLQHLSWLESSALLWPKNQTALTPLCFNHGHTLHAHASFYFFATSAFIYLHAFK